MRMPATLRLAAVLTCITVALGVAPPAQARSDSIDALAPHWLDQTVYRPNCHSADCACDCRSERFCVPACMRW